MTKLCPRGKAAAKRTFKGYPSAYANAYASKICAGKIKDPSGVKRKDFRGPKPMSKGGGADTGTVGEIRSKIGVMFNKAKRQGERIMGPEGRKERLKKIKKMAESAMNRDNIKKRLEFNKSFAQGRRELFKSTAGKNIPAIKKGAMMTAGSQSAMGRLQKARMMNKGGGADLKKDPTKPVNPFLKRRMKLAGAEALKAAKATRIGKIAAGVAGAALLGKAALEKMYEKRTGKKPFTKRPKGNSKGGLKAELNNPAKGYMAGGMADYYKDLM